MAYSVADQAAVLAARTAALQRGEAVPVAAGLGDAPSVVTIDDVLPDVAAYRAAALAHRFGDVEVAPGVVFHGIAECRSVELLTWLRYRQPRAEPTVSFFRQSPEGQPEPNYIHTDRDMGDWTALLYLTEAPKPGDGTTFYRRRDTGAVGSRATTPVELRAEGVSWRDLSLWEPWLRVPAKLNRCVIFPAALYHARALYDNYGHGDSARLVQIVFGRGPVPTGGLAK